MKSFGLTSLALFSLLTAAQPILAQEATSRLDVSEEAPARLSDLGMALNPQLGVSNFEFSEGGARQGGSDTELSGGLTVEFGKDLRKLETGLLVVQTGITSYLTIPMAAKIRLARLGAQQWYGKLGFMPAFELKNNRDTNNLDVIGTLGVGGRLAFTKRADFIIEASFNRGMMDALRTEQGDNLNQGFLVLAGMSFRL